MKIKLFIISLTVFVNFLSIKSFSDETDPTPTTNQIEIFIIKENGIVDHFTNQEKSLTNSIASFASFDSKKAIDTLYDFDKNLKQVAEYICKLPGKPQELTIGIKTGLVIEAKWKTEEFCKSFSSKK